jgi:hypothetical protein
MSILKTVNSVQHNIYIISIERLHYQRKIRLHLIQLQEWTEKYGCIHLTRRELERK